MPTVKKTPKEKKEKVTSQSVDSKPSPEETEADNIIKAASSTVDTDPKPSGKTDIAVSGGTGADFEIVRNKSNGNEQRIKGDLARKLIRRKPNEFEIVDPKKSK